MSNKLMILWGLIIFMICSTLLVIGNIGTDYELYKTKRYIVNNTKEYLEDYDINISFKKSKYIDIDTLIDTGYIKEKRLEDYCIEKVKITNKLYYLYSFEVIECKERRKI